MKQHSDARRLNLTALTTRTDLKIKLVQRNTRNYISVNIPSGTENANYLRTSLYITKLCTLCAISGINVCTTFGIKQTCEVYTFHRLRFMFFFLLNNMRRNLAFLCIKEAILVASYTHIVCTELQIAVKFEVGQKFTRFLDLESKLDKYHSANQVQLYKLY